MKRVIINGISPVVDNGLYPAKTIVDQRIEVSVNLFADGHDELGGSMLIKHTSEKTWKEHSLEAAGNDCWKASFIPTQLGIYQYRVQGWIDHFATWQKGITKKYKAGLDVKVELEIGWQLAEGVAARTKGKDKTAITKWVNELKGATDDSEAMSIATDTAIASLLCRCRDKNAVTLHPDTFSILVDPKRAEFSTWYELFPRSAATTADTHGTFKDVKALVPGIANMGFDVIYLPPIHPIGEKNRKGKNNSLTTQPGDPGSPWAIGSKDGGHKSIHPELGSLKDFKALVDECKKHNIEIALDIAFQCAPDHPYVALHPQWFKWRPDGTVQYAENPPKKYEDILPFNFETEDWEALWNELKSVIEYWIDKGVNIFRVDNPHTKALAFWEWMIAEVKRDNPQVLFLAEAFTRPRIMEHLAKSGFSQSYTYFTWRNTKEELEQYMTELTKTNSRHFFRPNFWPNTPDILPPEITAGGETAHIMRLILAATLSSNYGLYGPVYEYGLTEPMPGKEEYIHNEKYEIKQWDWDRYSKIKEVMIRVNRIRKDNPALHSTWNIELAQTTNENIICYAKASEDRSNILIIVVNLDPHGTHAGTVKVPLYKFGFEHGSYRVTDLLSGDKYNWSSEWNFVSLNPHDLPAHILRIEQ
ncbi:MAG: alpha-1,4-glucan--maltose-1-phosphate maltosyltransferase [Bacteroidota bacterium]